MAIKIRKKVSESGQASEGEASSTGVEDSSQEQVVGGVSASAGDVVMAAGGALVLSGGASGAATDGAGAEDEDEGAEFVREPEVLDVGGPGRRLRPMPPVGGDEQSKFVPQKQTAWDWMQSNHRPILLGMLAILLVSAGIVTVRWWTERSAGQASQALTAGLKPLDQWTAQEADSLQPHGKPDKRTPKGKYPDTKARAKEVLNQAEAGLAAHGQEEIGGELQLLAAASALRAEEKGKASEHAAAALKQLPPQKTQPFAAQVQASMLANEGKAAEAIEVYRQIQGQGPNYAPFALMNIGALLEQEGKAAEAAEAYKQLLQGYPQFQLKASVRHRLGLLVEDLDGYLAQTGSAAAQRP